MGNEQVIAAIDIGTSKIRTVIGSFDEENTRDFSVLGIGTADSNAIRKGNILDMDEFKNNLDASLEEAEKMSGEQISGAYISLNSSSMEVINSTGLIAVSSDEITSDDIDRALDIAKNAVDLPNREILKIIPEHFTVDLEEGVKNPLGMSARKLQVVANIFSINKNILDNIRKAVRDVGIDIYDVYPNLLASPEGVLTKRQKELGVVCIDLGSSTTGITVYEEGVLNYSSVIPLGSDSVTNDIALGARTSIDVAEKLKIDYSSIGLSEEDQQGEEIIELSKLSKSEEGEVSHYYLSQIVTARYEEILYFIKDELKKAGRDGMLPEGAIFVGGGSKAHGLVESAKNILKLPIFIGTPVEKEALSETSISDPVFAAVVGNMILANKYSQNTAGFSFDIKGMFDSLINMIKRILP